MHPLEKEILNRINEEKIFRSGETIVVGVSAGPDSMALFHVLASLSSRLNLNLIACHVNHGLRPDEADAEELIVRQAAQSIGCFYEFVEVDVEREAGAKKNSIEHAARDLRYRFFQKTAEKYKASKIAVAHTADDQAEEVLLRLIRGSGRCGLSGMKMIRDGWIVRPLLETKKRTLIEYLADRKIPYAIDSSNLQRKYLRNRIRLDLLPFLQEFNPNIAENLRQTALVFQDEEKILSSLSDAAWEEVVRIEGRDCHDRHPLVIVELKSFLSLEKALQRRIVEKIFIEMGSIPQFKKIEQILFLAAHGEGGTKLHFSRGMRMEKKQKQLFFSYPQGRISVRGDL